MILQRHLHFLVSHCFVSRNPKSHGLLGTILSVPSRARDDEPSTLSAILRKIMHLATGQGSSRGARRVN